MKYEQSLYKIVEPIRLNTIKRLNKGKKWEYGYNKENDVVVISKTGMVGQVIEIQGLQIALPKQPNNIYSSFYLLLNLNQIHHFYHHLEQQLLFFCQQ